MPGTEVCTVVDSILAAFSNGMDVFRRMAKRKQKRTTKGLQSDEEDSKLQNSLSSRPKQIRAEYEHSVVQYGHRFRTGDAESHSTLAHILLIMNTGLIEIINNALSKDKKARKTARKSLLDLSEVAAADTLDALARLNTRLTMSTPLNLEARSKRAEHGHNETDKSKTHSPSQERPPPSPLLARGGWVRSKSGSTVVSAASARRRAARKEEHQRSKSVAVVPLHDDLSVNHIDDRGQIPTYEEKIFQQFPRATQPPRPDSAITLPPYTKQRPPSMLIVPADYFENQTVQDERSPPRPPKIPLQPRTIPNLRARPLSGATFLTASTKIGEIPEHRLPDRVLSIEEQRRIPMPYVIPPPLLEEPKKKRKGFKLWKRQPVAVY